MTTFEISNLFLSTSLYKELDFPENYIRVFNDLFWNNDNLYFDAYCIHCQKDSTFKSSDKHISNPNYSPYADLKAVIKTLEYWNSFTIPIRLSFDCQRVNSHKYSIMFVTSKENKLIKVGQDPSIATIELHNIKKYRKVLARDYSDFSKGIGLVSHGIGIGSFVYLRRIFENLIEENHQLAKAQSGWDEELYIRSRMNEKVELLSDYLPRILVDSKQLYGIISKGIHELEEQECLDMFPQVKLAIELILDEKLYNIEKEKKASSIKKFVQDKTAELQSR